MIYFMNAWLKLGKKLTFESFKSLSIWLARHIFVTSLSYKSVLYGVFASVFHDVHIFL